MIRVAKDGYTGTVTTGGGVMLIGGVLHQSVHPTSSAAVLWIPVRSYTGPVQHVDTRGREIEPPSTQEPVTPLEREVRLLAEATRDGLTAIYEHSYRGLASYGAARTTLNAVIGRLDAVLSPLGVGAPSTRDGGEAGEGRGDG